MLDLTRTPDDLLAPTQAVVKTALAAVPQLSPNDLMIVGARCRDILHGALGHTFVTTATLDLDLALALSSWDAYRSLARAFPKASDSGICYRINGLAVDLLPFGAVEDPDGVVEPPPRRETMSVWAFEEIYAAASQLRLIDDLAIQIPTVAGYAAAKLGAWLDRCEYGQYKDASDLALAIFWYSESPAVQTRLYETPSGQEVLVAEDMDVRLASAHLLGADVATTIGPTRLNELHSRWPGDRDALVRELRIRGQSQWPSEPGRRSTLVDALTRGAAAV